jgi:serine/threonine protein kinase
MLWRLPQDTSNMNQDTAPDERSIPTHTPKGPSLDRTISSPPSSPASSRTLQLDYPHQPSSLTITTQLTPPTSPKLVRSRTDFEKSITPTRHGMSPVASSHHPHTTPWENVVDGEDDPLIIDCPFDVDIVRDRADRPQFFGQGAWSKVYRATGRAATRRKEFSRTAILTPPPSPQTSVPVLVAVKSPLSNASRTILHNEAITLSHLTRTLYHENFIVPFYGYIPSSASLVLAPIPLPLCDHIVARTRHAQTPQSDLFSTDPIVGSIPAWLDLADKLITALAWLHNTAEVVHGDIKPGNILLSPNRSCADFAFDPLLIDFSSSHIISSTPPALNTLSAVTREYTAPELLSPSVLSDPSSTATTASDVFSLAVTLIVAATGDLMVYGGNVWQRTSMAKQGWNILEFVRNGEGGMKVRQGGVVERVAEAAVRKIEEGRIGAPEWRGLVRRFRRDEEEIGNMAAARRLKESTIEQAPPHQDKDSHVQKVGLFWGGDRIGSTTARCISPHAAGEVDQEEDLGSHSGKPPWLSLSLPD